MNGSPWYANGWEINFLMYGGINIIPGRDRVYSKTLLVIMPVELSLIRKCRFHVQGAGRDVVGALGAEVNANS
jgi:hypothetical protein